MMKPNDFCINTQNKGSVWGKVSEWAEVSRIAKTGKEIVEYLGDFLTWENEVWAVFHTPEVNYLVKIDG